MQVEVVYHAIVAIRIAPDPPTVTSSKFTRLNLSPPDSSTEYVACEPTARGVRWSLFPTSACDSPILSPLSRPQRHRRVGSTSILFSISALLHAHARQGYQAHGRLFGASTCELSGRLCKSLVLNSPACRLRTPKEEKIALRVAWMRNPERIGRGWLPLVSLVWKKCNPDTI